MKRGDVVLMVMPGDLGKPRPGIVVQSEALGENTTTVIVCPLSSDVERPATLRPVLTPNQNNKLRLPSQIMTDKISAIGRKKIREVIGSLDPVDLERFDSALMLVLGLAR